MNKPLPNRLAKMHSILFQTWHALLQFHRKWCCPQCVQLISLVPLNHAPIATTLCTISHWNVIILQDFFFFPQPSLYIFPTRTSCRGYVPLKYLTYLHVILEKSEYPHVGLFIWILPWKFLLLACFLSWKETSYHPHIHKYYLTFANYWLNMFCI